MFPDVVEPGEFGWPCAVNADCVSGWCVPTPNGSVCSDFCITSCPKEGWACKLVVVNADTSYICLPTFAYLCDPCDPDDPLSCAAGVGDFGDLCLPYGEVEGYFCGGGCSGEVVCPEGYGCEEVEYPPGSGQLKRQCVPVSGQCTCSDTAIQKNSSTVCSRINALGTCEGLRECNIEGLTDCSAAEPVTEACNELDDDCDGNVDEADADGCVTYYQDVDNDGYGVDDNPHCLCGPEGLHSAVSSGDCAPETPTVYPNALEYCNEVDDDCDDTIDEAGAVGCQHYYRDDDQDGWGDELDSQCLCAPAEPYTSMKPGDCDDLDPVTYPGAPETCSGKDTNCDKLVSPENTPGCVNYFFDGDDDGYGVANSKKCLCSPETPYATTDSGDCDDNNIAVSPGISEQCGDNVDNDCSGAVDDGAAEGCDIHYKDSDSDGFGDGEESACLCAPSGVFTTTVSGDCNDFNGGISPAADEKCGDGLDNDCNGAIDEPNAQGCQTFYQDLDKDSYGNALEFQCLCLPSDGYTGQVPGDCDDNNVDVFPGKTESCNNVDDDCNGAIDEKGAMGCQNYYADNDKDQFGVTEQKNCLCGPAGIFTATLGGDCDDTSAEISPQAIETCDEADNNCDDQIDESGADGCQPFYFDADKDGYGIESNSKCLCGAEGSYLAKEAGDCKDTNDDVHPGQVETCNNVDDDCNDVIDDVGAIGCIVLYLDQDADGYGVPNQSKCLCVATDGWSASQGGDCNDDDLLVYPGTVCEPVHCDGYLLTQPLICGGEGLCNVGGDVAPCPGGFVCENDVQCKTACVDDADCVVGNFCVAGLCSGKKINGTPCASADECLSEHCQNGFCCASGDCCGGSDAHCDDGNTCTDDSCGPTFQCNALANDVLCKPSVCDGNNHTAATFCINGGCVKGGVSIDCSGTDPCKVYDCALAACTVENAASGTICGDATCVDYMVSGASTCSAVGACVVAAGSAPCPGGFVCASDKTCRSDCGVDEDCAPGYYCQESQCLPKHLPGASCSASNQCTTNHCENGHCCAAGKCCGGSGLDCDDNNVCTTDVCDPTFVCTEKFNTVQCKASTCDEDVFTAATYCSQGACTVGGKSQLCDTGNVCSMDSCSAAGCVTSPLPVGAPCAGANCFNFFYTAAKICDGTGGCTLGGNGSPCPGGFVCFNIESCRTSCTVDAHCQSTMYCTNGYCTPKRADGETCNGSEQCVSAHCGGGYCCSGGTCCGGKASDCDDGNTCTTNKCNDQYICKTVYNITQCVSGTCNGQTYIAPKYCLAGSCQTGGKESTCVSSNPCVLTSCTPSGCDSVFAPEGTLCKEPKCNEGGLITASKSCNGKGLCTLGGAMQECPGGYQCATANTCGTTCQDDSGCQNSFYCSGLQTCAPKRSDGESCSADNECVSSHCDNGFCCVAGECCGEKNSDCDDDNVCTTDQCSQSHTCTHDFNKLMCKAPDCNGLQYTAATYCNIGNCVDGGGAQSCAGGDSCQIYQCTPDGCQITNASTGTQCAPTQCAWSSITSTKTCDGGGQCNQGGNTAPCPGGLSCLDATSCRSTCVADSDCASGYHCGGGNCLPKRTNGEACQIHKQCQSNYCANGFCCDGPTGNCCGVDLDCNDENACTDDACALFACKYTSNTAQCLSSSCDGLAYQAPSTCLGGQCTQGGTNTDCSGSNPCKSYACTLQGCTQDNVVEGVQCAPASCVGHLLTQAEICNGNGLCAVWGQAAPCPGGLMCADGQSCRSVCVDDSHCQNGHYCQSGACIPQREDGEPCADSFTCLSGYCSNGFCCENDGNNSKCCGGSPLHCSDDNVCTGDTCAPGYVCQNTDKSGPICASEHCTGNTFVSMKVCWQGECTLGGIEDECTSEDPCKKKSCTTGGCLEGNQPPGMPCDSASCSGHIVTGSKTCDGSGGCSASGGSGPCPGGFICAGATQCKSNCFNNSDCQPGLYCATTACLPLKSSGQVCLQNSECSSNHCNNGYCCDSGACCATSSNCDDGDVCTNEACSATFQCVATPNTATCAAATCNGLVWWSPKICANGACTTGGEAQDCSGPNPCNVYHCTPNGCQTTDAAAGVQCMAASCSGNLLTQARTCNAAGACSVGGVSAPCPDYLSCLDATQCRTECTTNGHCVTGHFCANGQCLAKQPQGGACAANGECLSAYCDSGLCCDSGTCCGEDSDCADTNPCTTDQCIGNQCKVTNNSEVCVQASCDGTMRYSIKTCSEGLCQVGGQTEDCDKGATCHLYTCKPSGCLDTAAPTGTVCQPAQCIGNTLIQPWECDGSGSCVAAGASGPCPNNLLCKDGVSCWSQCTTDDQCVSGHYCDAGICLSEKANGNTCGSAAECQSNHCSGGLCCNSGICCNNNADCMDGNPCTNDLCQNNSCTYFDNEVTCSLGVCQGLLFTAPKICQGGACSAGGQPQNCGGSDLCKTYACTQAGCSEGNQPAGTQCASSSCTGSTWTTAKQCNVQGTCSDGGVMGSCPGSYTCKNSAVCHTTCLQDSHCVGGYFCAGGACIPKLADGQPCIAANECSSDHCENFVCCVGGDCCLSSNGCNDNNVCTTDSCISAMCEHTNNNAQCEAGNCNGMVYHPPKYCSVGACTLGNPQVDCSTNATGCKTATCSLISGCGVTLKGAGTLCGAASCDGTQFQVASVCDASGICQTSPPQECDDGSDCTGEESCNATQGCLAGTPTSICGDGVCSADCENASDCALDCACQPGHDWMFGEVDDWSTTSTGATNKINAYPGCGSGSFPGNEYAYRFTAPLTGAVKASLIGGDVNTHVFVLNVNDGDCDPANCFAHAQGVGSSVTFMVVAEQEYRVVVDRALAGGVAYQLYLQYTGGVCYQPFVEDWQRTPFPRAWDAEPNWQNGVGSPFGATHALFSGVPILSNFSRSLTSPVFDTSACTNVTLEFMWRFLQETSHTGVFLRVEISTNGGLTWSTVGGYATGEGDKPETLFSESVPGLAGSASARIRFRIEGDTTQFLKQFQIDSVKVK